MTPFRTNTPAGRPCGHINLQQHPARHLAPLHQRLKVGPAVASSATVADSPRPKSRAGQSPQAQPSQAPGRGRGGRWQQRSDSQVARQWQQEGEAQQGRHGQQRRETKEELAARLTSRIVKAGGVGDVAGPLRSAIRRKVAGPRLLTVALDRLQELHRRRKDKMRKEAGSFLLEACQRALEAGLANLAQADLRLLSAMARTPYWLQYQVPEEQQAAITDAFISLMQRSLDDHQQQQRAGSTALPSTRGSSGGSGGSSNSGGGDCGGASSRGASTADLPRELSNFVWAVFSNPLWRTTLAQRMRLMRLVRLVSGGGFQQHSKMLVGLMRLQQYKGPEAVAPFMLDGTVELVVERMMAQLGSAKPQECQDALLSMARLQVAVDSARLAALLQRVLGSVGADDRPLGVVSSTMVSLAALQRTKGTDVAAALELPVAGELAQVFVQLSLVAEPDAQQDEWGHMLTACAALRFDPPVGQGQRLFDVLLAQLPGMAPALQFFRGADVLASLGALYGLPGANGGAGVVGALPDRLAPHAEVLARLGTRLLRKWWRFAAAYEVTGGYPVAQARTAAAAFAALRRAEAAG